MKPNPKTPPSQPISQKTTPLPQKTPPSPIKEVGFPHSPTEKLMEKGSSILSPMAMKLPTGKDLDLRKILRTKTQGQETEIVEPKALENMDILQKGVMIFQKAGKEAKMAKKQQNYTTNQYLSGKLDAHNFDRIKIEPDLSGGSEEVTVACRQIAAVLKLRYKYLFHPHQDYNDLEKLITYSDTEPIIDYNIDFPLIPDLPIVKLENQEGVFNVSLEPDKMTNKVPSVFEFIKDLAFIIEQTHNVSNKTLAHNRLEILENKFKMHLSFNRDKETLQLQAISHRDFYNVRKVDTHIHHSACMRAKQLLEFIINKIKTEPNTPVILDKATKKPLTLKEVCEKVGIAADNINLDALNVQADSSLFQRFDRFNNKYNPMGLPELREIFLKSDNYIKGRYLAEITKDVLGEMEREKYCFSEWRISIYGRSINEWRLLAEWVRTNKLHSHQIRWMIQIPRLYGVYASMKIVKNFQEMIDNIFKPIFEVTLNPSKDPMLYRFLMQVVAFDTVDDESTYEVLSLDHLALPPVEWVKDSNPHYSYWIYYLYANLASLNELRKARGLNTFMFRPHCGESGNVDHLAAAFLVADGINHGIKLSNSPVLQYIYYLKQVGVAVSPLSNNKLFLEYTKNPFPKFFSRGLNVSLSTDDPLILHMTKEPLLEEYAVAAQVWNLSTVDLCEIARNSVLQSSWEFMLKKHWIGEKYNHRLPESNDTKKTNVPPIRYLYRLETLIEEEDYIFKHMA